MRNMKRGHFGWGMPYLTKRLASVRRTAQQRGDDRALRDYGIESCRLPTEIANRLLTGDPETVDTIKYMEAVCD
jgi:hypothetical protein